MAETGPETPPTEGAAAERDLVPMPSGVEDGEERAVRIAHEFTLGPAQ